MPSLTRARLAALPQYGRELASFGKSLLKSGLLHPQHIYGLSRWIQTGFPVPVPASIKWRTLERFGLKGVWIETGTHLGLTTAFLSNISTHTYSIEPHPGFAQKATVLFADRQDVTIFEGLSEDVLPGLLDTICKEASPVVSFWLDGHFSKNMSTFQGPSDTPVLQELDAIALHLKDFSAVSVLIDDMRCFDPQTNDFASYPKKSVLVNWAEAHDLFWTIEHDIFIATTQPTSSYFPE